MSSLAENVRACAVKRALFILMVCSAAFGCSSKKKVKVEFPRPPAVATASKPDENEPEAVPDESEVVEESGSAGASRPSAPEKPSQAEGSRNRRPRHPVSRPSAPPKPDSPAVPPPTPSLTPGSDLEESAIRQKLDQARTFLASVSNRALSGQQAEQASAAKAFIDQADKALEEGDSRRARVLADKGLILAEDLARSSR